MYNSHPSHQLQNIYGLNIVFFLNRKVASNYAAKDICYTVILYCFSLHLSQSNCSEEGINNKRTEDPFDAMDFFHNYKKAEMEKTSLLTNP